jgi:hypothetical protein
MIRSLVRLRSQMGCHISDCFISDELTHAGGASPFGIIEGHLGGCCSATLANYASSFTIIIRVGSLYPLSFLSSRILRSALESAAAKSGNRAVIGGEVAEVCGRRGGVHSSRRLNSSARPDEILNLRRRERWAPVGEDPSLNLSDGPSTDSGTGLQILKAFLRTLRQLRAPWDYA